MRTTQNNLPRECAHRRRIIDTPTHDYAFLAYCTECFWYQGGDLAAIAVEWIAHMEELNGQRGKEPDGEYG